MFDVVVKDIKYALRSLMKRRGFTVLAVITLALGIGINTSIFSVLNAVLLRPLPYADEARLVAIDETDGKGGMAVSPPNLLDFQQQNHTFEDIAGYTGGSFIFTGSGDPIRVIGQEVTPNLTDVLGVRPILGRSFTSEDNKAGQNRVALIAYSFWQQSFGGDKEVIGRQITLDSKSYSIAGVMPADFEFPIEAEKVELWVPFVQPEETGLRGAHYLNAIGRLKPDVSIDQSRADLELITQRLHAQFPDLVPGKAKVVALKQDVVGKVRPYLLMLAGAVMLVFLIAAANVTSLMLARAAERHKEIALRAALGASRSRQLRHFLAESLILSILGSVIGLLLASWATDLLIAIAPASDLPRLRGAHLDGSVLLFATASFLICVALLGVIPSLRVSAANLYATLKEGEIHSATAPRQALRKGLVVFEVTLAFVLLCGAGLLIKTLAKLNDIAPGFDPNNVLVAEIVLPKSNYPDDARKNAFFNQLLERVRALPDVVTAGGTSNLPMSGTNMLFMLKVDGQPGKTMPAGFRAVTSDYFKTMRIPVLNGRSFVESDRGSAQSVVVVSKTMAHQLWSGQDPLGKRIKHGFSKGEAEVIGVVDDVRYAGLDQKTKPELYAPFDERPFSFMRVVVRTKSDPAKLVAALKSEVQAIDKNQPIDKVTTMAEIVSRSMATRRFYMQLLAVFASLAFILAAVGIYGIVSYSVTQRTREIGIRLALGANRSDVLRLVLGEGIRLAVGGIVLGLVGAFAATRVLTSLLFQVKPTDPTTFLVLALLLAVVALFASYVPARRATKVDPLKALRYE